MPPLYHTPSLFDGKTCPRCHEWKQLTGFTKNRAQRDGLCPYCKPCAKSTNKLYQTEEAKQRDRDRSRVFMRNHRALHPDRNQAACRRHYRKNQERYLGLAADYRRENRSAICRKARIYYYANKEQIAPKRRTRYYANNEWDKLRILRASQRDQINERQRIYRKTDPLKYRVYDQTKNAKRKHAPGRHTAQDERAQYEAQGGLCFWCGDAVNLTFHIDHIQPLSKGGTNNADNICIACPWCNLHKWSMTPQAWQVRLLQSRPSLAGRFDTPMKS